MFALLPILAQVASTPMPSVPVGAPYPTVGVGIAASWLAIAIVAILQMVAYWIASKLLVSGNSSFGSAFKLWLTILAGMIGSLVLAGIIVAIGGALHNTPVIVLGFIVFALLALYVSFSTTMKVYEIGFLHAFGFLIIAGVIGIIVQFVASQTLKNTAMGASFDARGRRDTAALSAAFAQWQGAKPVAAVQSAVSAPAAPPAGDAQIAADRTQPVATRRAALQRWRDSLEARRVALKPQDQTAIAAYKQEAQRYGELFHELNAGAAKP